MNAKLMTVQEAIVICDPNQPRTQADEEPDKELTISVKNHGVKVPLIGYLIKEFIMLLDGHRRLKAARANGMSEVPVIVFPQKPEDADVLLAQMTIQHHRAELNPVDEFNAYTRLMELKKWTYSELAAQLVLSNSAVTLVMSMGKLSAEERQLVRDGKISKSVAYALSRMPEEQRALMVNKVLAGDAVRSHIEQQVRRPKMGEGVQSRRVTCKVSGGTVAVQLDKGLDLTRLIDVLDGLLRDCRKLRTQGLNISTAVKVLSDQCAAVHTI